MQPLAFNVKVEPCMSLPLVSASVVGSGGEGSVVFSTAKNARETHSGRGAMRTAREINTLRLMVLPFLETISAGDVPCCLFVMLSVCVHVLCPFQGSDRGAVEHLNHGT